MLTKTAIQSAQARTGDSKTQLYALARKYALIHDQVTDPGTSYQLTTSLLGDASAGQDISSELQGFAAEIIGLINDQIQSAVAVNAQGKVDQLALTLQVPVPFSTLSELPNNIRPVTTSIISKRTDNLLPGIEDKLPEAVESVADVPPRRGQKLPDFTKPRTQAELCADSSEDGAKGDDGKPSLIAYARNFEAAFTNFNGKGGMMKLAERAGLVADADSDEVDTLWAVRFAGADTTGPGISATYDPTNITYFALPPLNTEPVTRAVDNKTYNGIDMDAWSRRTLASIDRLFEPELGVAIALLDGDMPPASSSSETLTRARRDIAGAIAKTLELVLKDSPDGNQTKAAEQLEQAMLTRLSAAYAVSTVMQAPAEVTVRNSNGPTAEAASRPPELFGRIGPPLLGSKTDGKSKVYDLSSGRLDVANGMQWSTVLVTVTDQREHRSLSLDLEYDINAVQHDFEVSKEFDGYTPSSWLSFVLPGGVLTAPITGANTVDIPIPLPFEPPALNLTTQTAIGSKLEWKPGEGLSKLIEDALRWGYKTGLKTPLAAQDQLYFDAIFGVGDVTLHTSSGGKKKPINTQLFDAMAHFLDGWVTFEPLVPGIIEAANANPPDASAQDNARKAIAALTPLVSAVADAWNAPPAMESRLGFQEPEIIHYRLQIEHDQKNADDIILTLGGWMADKKGQVVRPGRWPVISFTPQSSGNDIPSWKVDGDKAQPQVDGSQSWWVVSETAPADSFPESFVFDWEGLDLSQRQLGRLQTWTRRNAELVKGRETQPDFIYETSVVSFASPGVPLIERNSLPTVAPEKDSTLESVLGALLQPLDFGDESLEPFIRLHANLRYTLATPADLGAVPLNAVYPLILQPNLVFSETGTTPEKAATNLAHAIAARRADFKGRGGKVYLDLSLTLFGAEEGQQVPLITIDPLILDVTDLPEDWWIPSN